MAYSQTNLLLANALTQSPDLSDQDRSQIVILIQQAIREARAAVALDGGNVLAWENLGQIYRSLINLAEGSEQWAIACLDQAILLDPTNPQLRLDSGGLLYSLGSFEGASLRFQQAASLKPDWANAYFNWGLALEGQEEAEQAKLAFERTLFLLPEEAEGRGLVEERLAALELGETAEATAAGQIAPPEPLPSRPEGIEEEIPLPEELGPEGIEETSEEEPVETE